LIKMIILEENFKWHLEAFVSDLFIYFSQSHFFPWLSEQSFEPHLSISPTWLHYSFL